MVAWRHKLSATRPYSSLMFCKFNNKHVFTACFPFPRLAQSNSFLRWLFRSGTSRKSWAGIDSEFLLPGRQILDPMNHLLDLSIWSLPNNAWACEKVQNLGFKNVQDVFRLVPFGFLEQAKGQGVMMSITSEGLSTKIFLPTSSFLWQTPIW